MNILLVDDDVNSLDSTRRILEHEQHQVETCSSGHEALALLSSTSKKFNLVITDVRMPGMTGMEFFEKAQSLKLKVPFIIMTAFGQIQDAVWAMKLGAIDFLVKPFKRADLLSSIKQVKIQTENKVLLNPISAKAESESLFIEGSSPKMKELSILIEQVARTDASILILGESGSGKEWVAKQIHAKSAKSQAPFIAINCAAMPENLIESELFGYEKGAFTGALQTKKGLFESADGGTLFLDEIGDLPLSLQPKLLRVIQEQAVRRIGSSEERPIQVRILAATHQNLSERVQQGTFRQDLFFRLDVVSLAVPALRDRIEDIAELSQYFLKKFSAQMKKEILGLEGAVLDRLMKHRWPGNVRELSNVIERAVVLSYTNWITLQDLPAHFSSQQPTNLLNDQLHQGVMIPIGMSLREVEDLLIKKALEVAHGDRAEAAKLLGVNERTIYRRMSVKGNPSLND